MNNFIATYSTNFAFKLYYFGWQLKLYDNTKPIYFNLLNIWLGIPSFNITHLNWERAQFYYIKQIGRYFFNMKCCSSFCFLTFSGINKIFPLIKNIRGKNLFLSPFLVLVQRFRLCYRTFHGRNTNIHQSKCCHGMAWCECEVYKTVVFTLTFAIRRYRPETLDLMSWS